MFSEHEAANRTRFGGLVRLPALPPKLRERYLSLARHYERIAKSLEEKVQS
jgi:hypothetical protein